MFTAQFTKGNGGIYRYYRCVKKSGPCSEPYMQEAELKQKIQEIVKEIAVPSPWVSYLQEKLTEVEKAEHDTLGSRKEVIEKQLFILQEKLDKLLEGYLDGLIDGESYARKKEELLRLKFSLKSEKESLVSKQMSGWNEPMREFIADLQLAAQMEKADNLYELARFFRKIGTNPTISAKTPSCMLAKPYDSARTALLSRRTRITAHSGESLENWELPLMCSLFDSARTFFESPHPTKSGRPRLEEMCPKNTSKSHSRQKRSP